MNYKHGESYTKLHRIWRDIKTRCLNKNRKDYFYYNGKGITICPEWANDYIVFRNWALNNGYQKDLEIDRRDSNGNYEPNNCRRISHTENIRNSGISKINMEKANKIRGLYNTGKYTQKELGEKFNIHQTTISRILLNKRWV